MDAVLQVIQTVGFPIAVAIACAWYIYKTESRIKDEAKEREDRQTSSTEKLADALNKSADAIQDSSEINKELSATNKLLVSEMKSNLASIGKSVDKILDKVTENK